MDYLPGHTCLTTSIVTAVTTPAPIFHLAFSILTLVMMSLNLSTFSLSLSTTFSRILVGPCSPDSACA